MERCDYYSYGYCLKHVHNLPCKCEGKQTKCDYFPNLKKVALEIEGIEQDNQLDTVNMYLKAQVDGKTYKCYDLYYNKRLGFHDKNKKKWNPSAFDTIDEIFGLDTWKEKLESEMTKSEAEAKFNIKIVGD